MNIPYIPILMLLLWVLIFGSIVIYNITELRDAKYNMNRLCKCKQCNLVHRVYQRKLIRKENICPHCHEYNRNFDYIYSHEKEGKYKYPLSPKISAWNAFKIVKLEKNQEENEFMDKQLEIYLKLQEKKLEELKGRSV